MSKQNASSVGAEMRDQCPRRFGAGRAFARAFFTPSLSSAGGKCIGHKPLSQQVSQSAATQTESYQGQSGQEPPGTTPVPPGQPFRRHPGSPPPPQPPPSRPITLREIC